MFGDSEVQGVIECEWWTVDKGRNGDLSSYFFEDSGVGVMLSLESRDRLLRVIDSKVLLQPFDFGGQALLAFGTNPLGLLGTRPANKGMRNNIRQQPPVGEFFGPEIGTGV